MECLSGTYEKVSSNGYYDVRILKQKWAALFDMHTELFGLPGSYEQYMKLMVRAAQYKTESINGKPWMRIKAKALEAKAQDLIASESYSIEVICAELSKFVGFQIRATTCSVVDFRAYSALMK